MHTSRESAEQKHKRAKAWMTRLGSELQRSPLNQITFVLAVGGTIVGVISGWSSVVEFISESWPVLLLSLVVGVSCVYALGRFSAASERTERKQRLDRVWKILSMRLDAGMSLTRQEALEILEQEYTDSPESLLSELVENRYCKVDYDDHIRRNEE